MTPNEIKAEIERCKFLLREQELTGSDAQFYKDVKGQLQKLKQAVGEK